MAISQVSPTLYLSGLGSLTPHTLAHRRITLVVNACSELPCPEFGGVEWIHVPVPDQPHAPLDQHFDGVAERIHGNRSGSSVVCCSAGRSRAPTLVMAYLMRYEGASLLQAHCRVLAARPFIRPNAGFWRQLINYEQTLLNSNSVRMVSTSQGVLPQTVDLTQDSPYCLNV